MNDYMTLSVISASVVYYILLMLIAVAVYGLGLLWSGGEDDDR